MKVRGGEGKKGRKADPLQLARGQRMLLMAQDQVLSHRGQGVSAATLGQEDGDAATSGQDRRNRGSAR